MKIVYISVFSLFLFASACGGVSEFEHEKLQNELTSKQTQLTGIEAELNQAKGELEALKSSYDSLRISADDTIQVLRFWKSDLEVGQALADSGLIEALLLNDDSFFENVTEEQMMQWLSITEDSLSSKDLNVNNQKLSKALKDLDQEWDKLGVGMMFSEDSPMESIFSELRTEGLSSSDVAIYEILIDMLKE